MSVDNSHPYDIGMSETCCFTKQSSSTSCSENTPNHTSLTGFQYCSPVFKIGSTIEHLVAESTLKPTNCSVGNRERIILKQQWWWTTGISPNLFVVHKLCLYVPKIGNFSFIC